MGLIQGECNELALLSLSEKQVMDFVEIVVQDFIKDSTSVVKKMIIELMEEKKKHEEEEEKRRRMKGKDDEDSFGDSDSEKGDEVEEAKEDEEGEDGEPAPYVETDMEKLQKLPEKEFMIIQMLVSDFGLAAQGLGNLGDTLNSTGLTKKKMSPEKK